MLCRYWDDWRKFALITNSGGIIVTMLAKSAHS